MNNFDGVALLRVALHARKQCGDRERVALRVLARRQRRHRVLRHVTNWLSRSPCVLRLDWPPLPANAPHILAGATPRRMTVFCSRQFPAFHPASSKIDPDPIGVIPASRLKGGRAFEFGATRFMEAARYDP